MTRSAKEVLRWVEFVGKVEGKAAAVGLLSFADGSLYAVALYSRGYETSFDFRVVDVMNYPDLMPDEAELSGYVKWDGCLSVDNTDHLCGPDGLDTVARQLRAVWALAHPLFAHTDYNAPSVEGLVTLTLTEDDIP